MKTIKKNLFHLCTWIILFTSLRLLGQDDIHKYVSLKPDFIEKWSTDSIEVKFNSDKCLVFSAVKSDYNKAQTRVFIEIKNNTGRDLIYKEKKTVDISIRHLAEWQDRLFGDVTNGSRTIDIIITKQVIKGKDTLYVFPKNQTWSFDDKIKLLIPTSRNIDRQNYFAEHTGSSFPFLPHEAKIIDQEKEKKEIYLEKKFKSPEKNNSKDLGTVTLQFDIPLFKKYKLYINDKYIDQFKRGKYYKFDFKKEQKIKIKGLTKKMKETGIDHEFNLKPGYDYFFTLHEYNIKGKMAELFDPHITLVNKNYIPK
ncbi:MAG: hypothetical protein ACK5AY_08145, partial [Bacteroidota bacterium]